MNTWKEYASKSRVI